MSYLGTFKCGPGGQRITYKYNFVEINVNVPERKREKTKADTEEWGTGNYEDKG